jgi:hypothetical protein
MEQFDGKPLRHLGDLPAMGAHRYVTCAAGPLADEVRRTIQEA